MPGSSEEGLPTLHLTTKQRHREEMADTAPHEYTVRARSGVEGIGWIDAKDQTIKFDRAWGGPPSVEVPGPAEVLASAFAACLLKNIERFSQLLPFSYEDVEVDVTIHRQDRPPRFDRIDYVITLTTDASTDRVALLAKNLSKYGTVYNTLAATCDVTGSIETRSPGAT